MTPEFQRQVIEAHQRFLALPVETRTAFLEQLRSWAPEIATELEQRLQQTPDDLPSPSNKTATVDFQPQPQSQAETGDYSVPLQSEVSTVDFEPNESSQAISTKTPPESDLPSFVPPKAGRFQNLELLAEGGMGAVLRSYDPEMDRTLAVKVMRPHVAANPKLRALFLRETRITGQLQHPGIPPIHDLGQLEDGLPYFGMKLIEGTTLADLLNKRQDPNEDLPRYLGIFEQICQTLGFAHQRGVIHRDLKPANIMVGEFGEVQVMDWGLAKFVNGDDSIESTDDPETSQAPSTLPEESQPLENETIDYEPQPQSDDPLDVRQSLSKPGDVMGTLRFMAPEQGRGENKTLDERCDVFGLGAILCVILTGAPPFQAKGRDALMQQVKDADLTEAQRRLDQCGADKEIVDLCRGCLAPNKEDRPSDGSDVAARVTQYLESVQERLKQAEIQKREAQVKTQEERKRRRVQFALGAVLVVLLLGVCGATLWYQEFVNRQVRLEQKREIEQKEKELANQQDAFQIEAFLTKFRNIHEEFDEGVRGEGVFELQNRRQEWTDQLASAIETLSDRGEKLLGRIEGEQAEEFRKRLDDLRGNLEEDQREWKIAAELGYIRERRMSTVDGKFDDKYALDNYPKAFEKAGLDLFGGAPEVAAKRIGSMRIRHQVIASLYDWAFVASRSQSQEDWLKLLKYVKLQRQLLQVAALVEGEPDVPALKLLQDAKQWSKLWSDQDALEELIERLPKNASPSHIFLVGNLTKENSPASKAWLDLASSRYPHDFLITFYIASRHMDSSPREALGYFRAAVNINPTSAATFNNWGNALSSLKKYDEAIEKFKIATKIEPKLAQAYTGWGVPLAGLKKYDEAIEKFKIATKIDENDAKAYSNWGAALAKLTMYDEAIDKFKNAI
ncbi:MAG: protein kinase [Gemmataceae bacterium]